MTPRTPPNDRRAFVHKRIIGAATGFLGGGITGGIGGFLRGGGSKRGRTPRVSDSIPIRPVTQKQMRRATGPGFADSAGCGRVGGVQLRRKFPGGPCQNPFAPTIGQVFTPPPTISRVTDVPGIRGIIQRVVPFGATGREVVRGTAAGVTDAAISAFQRRGGRGVALGGAPPGLNAVEPEAMSGLRLRCPRRYVLGIDDLCYFNLPRNSKWRKWRPGRKPKFTGGDLNAIARTAKLADLAEDLFRDTNPAKKSVARSYRANWRKPLKK